MKRGAAFYCVTDARYFLGAAGLVNSLRLARHEEPVLVFDAGMTAAQREMLAPHATVVSGSSTTPAWLLKTVAPLAHPAEVMVLIDVDMLVTRNLGALIERAAGGRVVAFRNESDRFVPGWGDLLDLGEARRGPYVSSGLVLLGGELGERVLRLMDERAPRVDFELTFWRRNVREYPFLYADQDVLNAILATRVEPRHLDALEARLAAVPPYRGLRLLDEGTVRCAYRDGAEPYVIHQYVRKPWLEPMRHGLYSRLLARLLLEDDVAVRVPEEEIPLRMRRGPAARIERARVDTRDVLDRYLRRPVAAWVRDRARDVRRRAAR